MKRRGFSLVELLVVLMVLAILLGIALPMLAGARSAWRRVACQANLRTIGQALSMFLEDEKGLLPYADWDAQAGSDTLGPWDTLVRYMEAPLPRWEGDHAATHQPWACPSDPVWARQTGFSYAYPPGGTLLMYPAAERPAMHRRVSQAFLDDPNNVVVMDRTLDGLFAPEHRNTLRSDLSVRSFDGVILSRLP